MPVACLCPVLPQMFSMSLSLVGEAVAETVRVVVVPVVALGDIGHP